MDQLKSIYGGKSAPDERACGHCITCHGPGVLRSSRHTDSGRTRPLARRKPGWTPADSPISLVKRARRPSRTERGQRRRCVVGRRLRRVRRENVRCADIGEPAPTTNGNVTARWVARCGDGPREHATNVLRRRNNNNLSDETATGSGSTAACWPVDVTGDNNKNLTWRGRAQTHTRAPTRAHVRTHTRNTCNVAKSWGDATPACGISHGITGAWRGKFTPGGSRFSTVGLNIWVSRPVAKLDGDGVIGMCLLVGFFFTTIQFWCELWATLIYAVSFTHNSLKNWSAERKFVTLRTCKTETTRAGVVSS